MTADTYKDQLAEYKRGIYMYNDNGVTIHDELITLGKKETDIRWSALTYSKVRILKTGINNDGKVIQLSRSGKPGTAESTAPMMRCVLLGTYKFNPPVP